MFYFVILLTNKINNINNNYNIINVPITTVLYNNYYSMIHIIIYQIKHFYLPRLSVA